MILTKQNTLAILISLTLLCSVYGIELTVYESPTISKAELVKIFVETLNKDFLYYYQTWAWDIYTSETDLTTGWEVDAYTSTTTYGSAYIRMRLNNAVIKIVSTGNNNDIISQKYSKRIFKTGYLKAYDGCNFDVNDFLNEATYWMRRYNREFTTEEFLLLNQLFSIKNNYGSWRVSDTNFDDYRELTNEYILNIIQTYLSNLSNESLKRYLYSGRGLFPLFTYYRASLNKNSIWISANEESDFTALYSEGRNRQLYIWGTINDFSFYIPLSLFINQHGTIGLFDCLDEVVIQECVDIDKIRTLK